MAKLWLEKEVESLLDLIDSSYDEETKTWSDEDRSIIEGLTQEQIDPTLDRYYQAVSFYKEQAEALANEIKRLQDRKKMFENKMEHIKGRVLFALLSMGGKRKTTHYTFSTKKTTSIEVSESINLENLPDKFKTIKVEVSKTALKDGCEVDSFGNLIDTETGKQIFGVSQKEKTSLAVR